MAAMARTPGIRRITAMTATHPEARSHKKWTAPAVRIQFVAKMHMLKVCAHPERVISTART